MSKFRLNGADLHSVHLIEGNYLRLLNFADAGSNETIDYAEDNGIDVYQPAFHLSDRRITLELFFYSQQDYNAFYLALNKGAENDFYFPELDLSLSLQLLASKRLMNENMDDLEKDLIYRFEFLAKMNKDFSRPDIKALDIRENRLFLIDDKPMAHYNTFILEGALASLLGRREWKNGFDRQKSFDISLPLLTKAENLAELRKCLDALLFDITRAGGFSFISEELGLNAVAIYKRHKTKTLFIDTDRLFCLEHLLTLTLIKF